MLLHRQVGGGGNNSLSRIGGIKNIYPNPVYDVLTIDFDPEYQDAKHTIEVYNSQGIRVYLKDLNLIKNLSEITIDTFNFSPDSYTLLISSYEKGVTYEQKFIKP